MSAYTNLKEARAVGREYFWNAKPIWLNPHEGHEAREWTRGWRQGLAEYLAAAKCEPLPLGERYTVEQLRLYRPPDVPELKERRHGLLTRHGRSVKVAAQGRRGAGKAADGFVDGNTMVLRSAR